MQRRTWTAVAVGATLLVLLAAASTSGPTRLWTAPPPRPRELDTVERTPITLPTFEVPARASDPVELPAWLVVLGRVVVVAFLVLLVLAAVMAIRSWTPTFRVRLRRIIRRPIEVLPSVDEPTITLDVRSARSALDEGEPRNAIIACWMQLQRDASDAGVERRSSETSTEYVERVIATASVDAGPIGTLAALYREARFSRHEVSDEQRLAAGRALEAVEAALRQASPVPA
ncbi:MAG: DUF4129 domain-containing protein [Ilumatobacteraceae bacterium]